MIFLLSPAKTLDFETSSFTPTHTNASFLSESSALIDFMRGFDWEGIHKLLSLIHI